MGAQALRHGSLFSGIGGFDLAAEWIGWINVFHCELNPFCRQVLNYYYPTAESYGDIKKTDFSSYMGRIDILTGGFPCQPYSTAGKRLGKEDPRHLWPEMLRAIREIQPLWVVGENVRGLISWDGGLVFHEVQSDLEAEGYEVLPFYFQLQGSTPRTEGNASGLLPTVVASDGTRSGEILKDRKKKRPSGQAYPPNLSDLAKSGLLPTPTVQDFKRRGPNSRQQGLSNTENWAFLLPTPTAVSDAKGGCTRQDPKRQNATLAHAVHGMAGTPGRTSQLNPRFVMEMMGFPPDWTALPFQGGVPRASKPEATR